MTGPVLLDDPDAIVGASGAGKSYTGRAKVEQLLEARRHAIIFDPTGVWYGLRSDAAGTGPGFDIPIFGGPHADPGLAIRPDQGAAVAGILLDQRVSAVIDLSEFDEADLRVFALGFLAPLRHRERVNLHLVFDEAEEFAPQTAPDDVGFQLVRQMTWIAKRGRVFGLVPTFITQRPADFAKAVLSQVQTLYFHQLIAPADQAPVRAYLKANADKETLQAVESSLPELGRGERWVYSPRRKLLERGTTAPIATFDSMATPPPGEAKREPRTLSQLDVGAIAAALAPPVRDPSIQGEPAEAYRAGHDAGALLLERDRRIAELEVQLARAEHERHVAAELGRRAHQALNGLARSALEQSEAITAGLRDHLQLDDANLHSHDANSQDLPDAVASTPGGSEGKAAGDRSAPPSPAAMDATEPLNGIAQAILANLREVAPASLTWQQAAMMAGRSPKSGPFYAAKRQLLASQLVEAVANGVRAAGGGNGVTRRRALEIWRATLKGFAPRMLDQLWAAGWITRDELGTRMGVSTKSGPWFGGLKALREPGLIEEGGLLLRLARPLPGQSAA